MRSRVRSACSTPANSWRTPLASACFPCARPLRPTGADRDAAGALLRSKQCTGGIAAEPGEHALDQGQVESADEFGMARGDVIEGTIAQPHDPRLGRERFVAA